MPSNYNPTEGIATNYEPLDLRMDAYDQLPTELRQVLDECPIEQSAIETLWLWRLVGRDTARAVQIFRETIQLKLPGYTPPARRARPATD